jgi:uncharacterized coiled-coil protein SlyX
VDKLDLILNELRKLTDRIGTVESNMATKSHVAEIEARMATKDDIAEIESRMATKDDIAELPYIKQAVLENSQSIAYLSDTLRQVAETVARIEVNHGDKLAALFDAVEVQNDVNEEILEAIKRINT